MTDYKQKRADANVALKAVIRPIRGRLMFARILTVLSCVIAVAPYVALTRIGNILLQPGPQGVDLEALYRTSSLLVMAFLTQLGLYLFALVFTHFADVYLRDLLQQRLAQRVAGAPLAWFSQSNAGRVRKAIQDDTVQVHTLVAHAPVEQTAAILTPVVLLVYAFTVDWRLGLLTLSTFPIFAAGQAYMMRDMGEKTAQMDDKLADISACAVELTDGIHVVKNYGQTGKAHGRFTRACEDFADFYWDWCGTLIKVSALSLAFISVPTLMVINLGVGLVLASAGWVSIGEVLTCSLIALILPRTVEVLGNTAWAYQQAGNAALRLQKTLEAEQIEYPHEGDLAPGVKPSSAASLASPAQRVVFEDVHYAYPSGEAKIPALQGVDLVLEPGTVTALIGSSGSGKSTLATMLARFRDPDRGRITIGDTDLRDLPESALYRLVGFVLQEPYLQRRSVREVVCLGKPEATVEELREAARKAQILEDVEALPRGWDTILGEETDLSGGQKQRLAIARALLVDPPILVLDEATAATDPDCEAQIQAALRELARGRTVLVIAHHAESVRGCDQICIFDAGTMVARGNEEQLRDHPYWVQMLERSL